MNKLSKKQRAGMISDFLFELYPEAECSLDFKGDAYRLLVMSRLSAQCTDARVNIVSEELFKKLPDVYAFAAASYEDIEKLIRPCGLFRTKAKSIRDCAVMLVEKFDGKVPKEMDMLLSLPGIGRKIANLMRGDLFGLGGIVADTHCIRLSGRFGLCESDSPLHVEKTLDALIPKQKQSGFCHRTVYFGREYCKAANPGCDECPLKKLDARLCVYKKTKRKGRETK